MEKISLPDVHMNAFLTSGEGFLVYRYIFMGKRAYFGAIFYL